MPSGDRTDQLPAATGSPFADFGLPGEPGTEAFWTTARTPVSRPGGGGGWTTLFLRRGGPADISFESWTREPLPLRRWGATDCWYAEVEMPARLRVTYRFITDEGAHADPFNPSAAGGDRSIAATPDAPAQPYWPLVGADDVLPVPRTRLRWASARLGGRRTVRVHPVAGGGPVVLLLDGDDWLYLHPAMTAFEAAVADGALPPVTLVFLPSKDRMGEFACRPELWEAVRDELLPLVAESGVPADPDTLVVAGQSLGGLSALYAALEFPELVTRVACQSGSFWWAPDCAERTDLLDGPAGGALADRLRQRPGLSGLRIAFDLGEHETRMLPHCTVVEALTEQAGADVRVSRSPSDHDRAGWRHAMLRDVAWALG
ncbi:MULTISPECIES: alpha/beta hydrolase-fold protein [unclassified Streptomyces]|uniref:alpha/beta hydrolase-fold protein n=1 Tax=unclassified Streptomyces TaxID=2593676 RepID=UPI00036013A5|nr:MULTISPECIES: alpha/beta hydrolase-fold protein [unclassified Streptomyces]MYQ79548.1 enterochelin esterase [Streptomyces sp. SID4923]